MWQKVANTILRYRLVMLSILAIITLFFAYNATKVTLQYEFASLLPSNDPTFQTYEKFKKDFGQDGMMIVIATNDKDFYQKDKFNAWYNMGIELKNLKMPVTRGDKTALLPPIDSIFSEAHLYNLFKNKEAKKFELRPVMTKEISSQVEMDSIAQVIQDLPFYKGVINKSETDMHMMMLFLNKDIFNSKDRGTLIDDIQEIAKGYGDHFNEIHFSGLPFIRSLTMSKVKSELFLFVILALLVTSTIMFFFFRSFKVVLISMLVVVVGVIWSFGIIGFIGYEITILMGLIPPLVIVIGIPNCIYLINKYQQDYRTHGNKAKSLTRVIRKVGNATFLTNATTAMGFGTFIFTHSNMMKEFGVVASINIICIFFISILIVPIIYSYLAPPNQRQTKHLDNKWLDKSVDKLVLMSTQYRRTVYLITIAIILAGFYGMSLMHTSGSIVDDLPKNDIVVQDLKYFEKELNGILPFEIVVESKDTIYNKLINIDKIQKLQKAIRSENYLSQSLSVVDAVKFLNQAFKNGNPEKFSLDVSSANGKKNFGRLVKSEFFKNTFQLDSNTNNGFISSFIDATKRRTRVTLQVADIGTASMDSLMERVQLIIDTTLNPEYYHLQEIKSLPKSEKEEELAKLYSSSTDIQAQVQDYLTNGDDERIMEFPVDINSIGQLYGKQNFLSAVEDAVKSNFLSTSMTGTGIVYTKGTTYLVKNLFISLMIAVCVVAILMSLLFRSWRMVLVSMIPNLIPLIITSAIMGYFGIPIKPSTILVFSIAFGISIDDTIHFLAKYRQELKVNNNIRRSAIVAIKETGVSMIYTSIILFFGFSIFVASNFGGTQALGILVSVTLFFAMLANLVLLPSLLLSLDKMITTKTFRDYQNEFIDNDEDIEIDELKIYNEK